MYKHISKLSKDDILALAGDGAPDNIKFALECLKASKRLSQAQAGLLDEWIDEQQKAAQAAPPVPSEPDDMQKNVEYNRRVQEDLQKQSKQIEQRKAAVARLQKYEREQGLLNTELNHELINEFLLEAPELTEWRSKGAVLSSQIIDAAIKWLRPKLQWTQAEVKPAEPVVARLTLADGTEQLPFGTAPSYKHSKVQLADLARREVQAKSRNRHGWHGGGRI